LKKAIKHIPERYGFRTPEAAEWPTMLLVATSFVCNSDCIHCPNAKSRRESNYLGSDKALMEWETFKKVADEAQGYKVLLRFSAGGEPLMHPKAVEMIEYACSKNVYMVSLTTNGSLLTKELAERILRAGITLVEISVDGYTKETYEKIRRGLNFDVVKANIHNLVDIRNTMKIPALVIISIIDQPEIAHELKEAVAYWEKIVDRVMVRRYLTFQGVMDKGWKRKEPFLPKNTPCPFPWERMSIDPAGNLRFCVSDITGRSIVGNIATTTVHKVWTGDLFNRWRKLHLEGRGREVPFCEKCTDWEYRSWNYNYFYAIEQAKKRLREQLEI
jgi:MoaA/NifB/PqqE/SkfB family radical SAM enzyme